MLEAIDRLLDKVSRASFQFGLLFLIAGVGARWFLKPDVALGAKLFAIVKLTEDTIFAAGCTLIAFSIAWATIQKLKTVPGAIREALAKKQADNQVIENILFTSRDERLILYAILNEGIERFPVSPMAGNAQHLRFLGIIKFEQMNGMGQCFARIHPKLIKDREAWIDSLKSNLTQEFGEVTDQFVKREMRRIYSNGEL